MKKALALAAVVGLAFTVTACQSFNTEGIDAAIQRNLPQVCNAAAVAHVAFAAVAEAGHLHDVTVRREAAAWRALQPFCVNPSSATTGDVLVAAVSSYMVIAAALEEAQIEGG